MKMRKKISIAIATGALAVTAGVAPVRAASTLNGGGSSFVANLVDICRAQYNRNSTFNSAGDIVNYTSSSSGTGKTSFASGAFAWAGSDSLYTSGAPANFVYVPLVAGSISVMYHLEGITPASATVRLSPDTIGKIFAGQIKMWNDPAIQADNKVTTVPAVKKVSKNGVVVTVAKVGTKLNFTATATASALSKYKGKPVTVAKVVVKGASTTRTQVAAKNIASNVALSAAYVKGATYAIKVGGTSLGSVGVDSTKSGVTIKFPSLPIRVAYRSGTSGTTNNFTKFLNGAAGSVWTKPGNDAFTSAFPGSSVPSDGTFQAANGSDGVANYVRDNNGAITYAELSYAEERKSDSVKSVLVKNNAGEYVGPSAAATAAFYAEAAIDDSGVITPDYTVKAADAYLINAVAYGLGYKTASADNAAVGRWYSYFIDKCAPSMGAAAFYAPLAGAIKTKALAQVAKINAG